MSPARPSLEDKLKVHGATGSSTDDRGELISESFYDVDGKPKDQQTSGYARVTYQYDSLNRIITKSYFGDDGAPPGAAKSRRCDHPPGI